MMETDSLADAIAAGGSAGSLAVRFAAGDTIYRPGDAARGWIVLEGGRVKVSLTADTGREVTLYRIEAGESCILTTSALLSGEAMFAEALAETDVRARLVPTPVFERLLGESAEFRRVVLRNYAERVADLVAAIQDVLFHAVPERLARLLLAGSRDGVLTTTHQALAAELVRRARSSTAFCNAWSAKARSRSSAERSALLTRRVCARPRDPIVRDKVTDGDTPEDYLRARQTLEAFMTTNVGAIDRILRIIIGIVLIAFALGFIATGSPYAWLGWIGVIPLLTALVGSCPLYSIIGLSTCPVDKRV